MDISGHLETYEDEHLNIKNIGGTERFVRGLLGASLISWALNGHIEGWFGLFFTLTAVLEYCPIRGRFAQHSH